MPSTSPPRIPAARVSTGRGAAGASGATALVWRRSVGSPPVAQRLELLELVAQLIGAAVTPAPSPAATRSRRRGRIASSWRRSSAVRSATTPRAKPLARSRARSGVAASAVTATMLLCATGSADTLSTRSVAGSLEAQLAAHALGHVATGHQARRRLHVAGGVVGLPDQAEAW